MPIDCQNHLTGLNSALQRLYERQRRGKGDRSVTIDREALSKIESALDIVDFGEIIIIVHDKRITGIDVKCRQRMLSKKEKEV